MSVYSARRSNIEEYGYLFLPPKKPILLCSLISPDAGKAAPCAVLVPGETMKSFLERLAGGRCSFRDLGMGETAAPSHSTLFMALSRSTGSGPEQHRGVRSKGLAKGMRSPASRKRDVNKPLKKQAREPWNESKGFMVFADFS